MYYHFMYIFFVYLSALIFKLRIFHRSDLNKIKINNHAAFGLKIFVKGVLRTYYTIDGLIYCTLLKLLHR